MPSGKILIVCYSFPPYPGIGGRRWAKFSKELAKNNYKIIAINAINTFNTNSIWTKDIDENAVKVISFPFFLQRTLQNPSNILGKILRKAVIRLSRFTKYNTDILTSYPNTNIWRKIKSIIIDECIETVIISGDPFLFYYGALLKKEIDFKLILDYRDLWNDHSFYEKNVKLNPSQRNFFEYAENYAVNHCDKILFVDTGLETKVKSRIKNSEVKTYVLHNGYDSDDYLLDQETNKRDTTSLNIFFAGNISSDVNTIFINFFESLSELKVINPLLFGKIKVQIIGNMDLDLIELISKHAFPNVSIENRFLNFEEYVKFISHQNIGLIHLSKEYADSFATKFSDFLKLDVFSLSIGYRGKFAEIVEENGIGIHYDMGSGVSFFEKLEIAYRNRKYPAESIMKEFDVKDITQKLIEIMNYA